MSDEGTDEGKKERRKHLRLVPPPPPEWALRVLAELPDLTKRPYNRGMTFDRVLEARDDLLDYAVKIRGAPKMGREEKVTCAKAVILRVLHLEHAVIHAGDVNRGFILRLAEEADMHNTDSNVFHYRRIARKLNEAAQYLDSLANIRLPLEALEYRLLRDGVRVLDTDAIRLFIYELNREHLVPFVLGLPNAKIASNPRYALVEGNLPLPAVAAEFIHLLNN